MPSSADFATKVRDTVRTLRDLASEAGAVDDATPAAQGEAAAFLHEAAADCEDAIRAVGETP